jgi:hypothetical protein
MMTLVRTPLNCIYRSSSGLLQQEVAVSNSVSPSENLQDDSLDSPVDAPHREASQNRRVQKFFGENFDVKMTEIAEKTHVGLKREISHDFQPSHVEVSKLNKFFGRHAPVQHREPSPDKERISEIEEESFKQGGDDDDNSQMDDSDGQERRKERANYKTNQKLRKYFGAPVDAEKGTSLHELLPSLATHIALRRQRRQAIRNTARSCQAVQVEKTLWRRSSRGEGM